MSRRLFPLHLAAFALIFVALAGCKTIYRDTFSPTRSYFVAPVTKQESELSKLKLPPETRAPGGLPEQAVMPGDPSVPPLPEASIPGL